MRLSLEFRRQKAPPNLFGVFEHVIREHDLNNLMYAPLDVIWSPAGIVKPYLLFFAKENVSRVSIRGAEDPVDLGIEICSPFTKHLAWT